jgi:hypothetical protein
MRIAIGITHYPRKVETLQASLVTMPAGTEATIYPDGTHHVSPYIDVEVLGEHAGCFRHWYRVLEHLCTKDVDAVGIMPDDVQYHPKTWRVVAHKLRDERTGYVAAFLPKGMADRYEWGKGWHTCNNGWASSWGGGYVFPIAVARQLLQHPFIIDHRNNYAANKQIDHAIPEAVHQMGLNQWYHYPSLLRHIGFTSTIGHEHTEAEDAAGW